MAVREISRSSVRIGNRAREDYGDLKELKASIESSIGQIQTVAVCQIKDEPGMFQLLAGGRRIAAMDELHEEKGHLQLKIPGNDYYLYARIYPEETTDDEKLEI